MSFRNAGNQVGCSRECQRIREAADDFPDLPFYARFPQLGTTCGALFAAPGGRQRFDNVQISDVSVAATASDAN